jgi:hypothetical protein
MSTATGPSAAQAMDYGRKTRYTLFAVMVFVFLGGILWSWGSVYAIWDRGIHIGKDRLDNEVESRVVEMLLVSEGIITCSGSFIRETGEILIATHCLAPATAVCAFDPTLPGWPFSPYYTYYVEVMGVNDAGDKYIFPFEIVASSGITDVAIIKPLPLTLSDGSVITITDQDAFGWDESTELSRGDMLQGLAYDVAFLKKLSHKGPVQAAGKDRGTSFAVSVEQVFVDQDIQPGASGMGMFTPGHRLMLAPMSYRWDYSTTSEEDSGATNTVRLTASGTSSRVSRPLTDRMLNPATPANGVGGRYLVPSLGIIPYEVVSGVNLFTNWGPTYVPFLQNRGIIFTFLASQTYYNYVTNVTTTCLFPAYSVTPPSMLGAPLDEVISGTPPDPFPDFPGGTHTSDGIMTILVAIEGHLDRSDWHYLGEDAGLTTVSGVLMGTGKWVGDTVRVRILSIHPSDPTNPASNWEAIYRVVLNAIDPFWDSLAVDTLGSYVSYIRVNDTQQGVTLHMDPVVTLPQHVRGLRRIQGFTAPTTERGKLAARSAHNNVAGNMYAPIPSGVDVYTLPTLGEHYGAYAMAQGAVPSQSARHHVARAQYRAKAGTRRRERD